MDLFDIVVAKKLAGGSGDGGGGGSRTLLFEETVTTSEDEGLHAASLSYSQQITADTIVVTFDGTEYTVSKEFPFGNARTGYGTFSESGPVFTTYPFYIMSEISDMTAIYTETAGTYTVKVEVPSSGGGGGSSDFTTATVTVNGDFTQSGLFIAPVIEKDPNNEDIAFPMIQSGNSTCTVILYKGRSTLMFMGSQSRTITVSGNIETVDTGMYIITGDCTITIS